MYFPGDTCGEGPLPPDPFAPPPPRPPSPPREGRYAKCDRFGKHEDYLDGITGSRGGSSFGRPFLLDLGASEYRDCRYRSMYDVKMGEVDKVCADQHESAFCMTSDTHTVVKCSRHAPKGFQKCNLESNSAL